MTQKQKNKVEEQAIKRRLRRFIIVSLIVVLISLLISWIGVHQSRYLAWTLSFFVNAIVVIFLLSFCLYQDGELPDMGDIARILLIAIFAHLFLAGRLVELGI